MKKRKNETLLRLKKWLDNGDDALELEMEDALEEEDSLTPAPADEGDEAEEKMKIRKDGFRIEKHPVYEKVYIVLAVVICVVLIGVLLFAALKMPMFGEADTLIDSELSEFYAEHTLEEIGALNIIAGIILDYRGFDTLGESHVLFIGICTVLLMLSIRGEKDEEQRILADAQDRHFEPRHDEILQTVTRILTPMILIFGIYVIVNGHLSPGGGFSGGAILGAGLILYQNAFGYAHVQRFFTFRTFKYVSLCSLLFYSCAKGYHFFTGANHLESGISPGIPGNILSAGLLLPLNIVVGLVVACTMYALYTMFRKGDF